MSFKASNPILYVLVVLIKVEPHFFTSFPVLKGLINEDFEVIKFLLIVCLFLLKLVQIVPALYLIRTKYRPGVLVANVGCPAGIYYPRGMLTVVYRFFA